MNFRIYDPIRSNHLSGSDPIQWIGSDLMDRIGLDWILHTPNLFRHLSQTFMDLFRHLSQTFIDLFRHPWTFMDLLSLTYIIDRELYYYMTQ